MSAAFALRLDTTPPQATLSAPAARVGDRVLVGYTLTEGRVESALLGAAPLEVRSSDLVVPALPVESAVVRVTAVDDVGNRSVTEYVLIVLGRELGEVRVARVRTHRVGVARVPEDAHVDPRMDAGAEQPIQPDV